MGLYVLRRKTRVPYEPLHDDVQAELVTQSIEAHNASASDRIAPMRDNEAKLVEGARQLEPQMQNPVDVLKTLGVAGLVTVKG